MELQWSKWSKPPETMGIIYLFIENMRTGESTFDLIDFKSGDMWHIVIGKYISSGYRVKEWLYNQGLKVYLNHRIYKNRKNIVHEECSICGNKTYFIIKEHPVNKYKVLKCKKCGYVAGFCLRRCVEFKTTSFYSWFEKTAKGE